jgi:hypothetical protein
MEATGAPETATVGGKRNPWLTHVKKTMKSHKGKSFKAILKIAKKTFKKSSKKGGALSPLPLKGGRKTRRTTRKH